MVGWLEKISDIMVCWLQKLKTDKNPLKQSQKMKFAPEKNYTKPRIWSYLSINFRFSGRFSKPKKLATKIFHIIRFCWPSGLGNYFACKRFAVHSNPLVVTGTCDPNKSQARQQHNTVYLKKLHLTNLNSLNVTKNILQQHS